MTIEDTGSIRLADHRAALHAAVLVFTAVAAASLFGIFSRPVGLLASIWPANAVMLGMMLRLPGADRAAGWLAGTAAFLVADFATGSPVAKALMLNGANLVAVAGGLALLSWAPAAVRTGLVGLGSQAGMLWLISAACAAGIAAGIAGAVVNSVLFSGSPVVGFRLWFIGEIANMVMILPVILAAPRPAELRGWLGRQVRLRRGDLLPALAVLASCLAAIAIGGPGAVAIPVVALLWAAMTYAVFPTAILTLLSGMVALTLIEEGGFTGEYATSFRLGVAAMTVAPVMLAIIIGNRNELTAKLRAMAMFDALTGISNRASFLEAAGHARAERGGALLMIDLDHFKSVNDRHGHAGGDQVLRLAVARINAQLRSEDLFGRLGGEEFAVFLPGCSTADAVHSAERIRAAICAAPVDLPDGSRIQISASIGVTDQSAGALDQMLLQSDLALYEAKAKGRNRVIVAGAGRAPPVSAS